MLNPFSCPFCSAQAKAGAGVQICSGCRKQFTLRAGARVDPEVKPPPIDMRLKRIKTTSAGAFVRTGSWVAPEGVLHGTMDPITGAIPIDQAGVLYTDIISVAVFRKLDVVRLVLLALIGAPIMFGCLAATISIPPVGILLMPLFLLFAWAFYATIAIQRNYARVCGSIRVITVQFDQPSWRRRPFHDELLRRAGISPSPIP